jgi:hypothetical protein
VTLTRFNDAENMVHYRRHLRAWCANRKGRHSGLNATDARLTGMRAELDRWRHLSVSTDGSYAT